MSSPLPDPVSPRRACARNRTNIEHPTSNTEHRSPDCGSSTLDVRCSVFDVRPKMIHAFAYHVSSEQCKAGVCPQPARNAAHSAAGGPNADAQPFLRVCAAMVLPVPPYCGHGAGEGFESWHCPSHSSQSLAVAKDAKARRAEGGAARICCALRNPIRRPRRLRARPSGIFFAALAKDSGAAGMPPECG
jgi:hypothetical protein